MFELAAICSDGHHYGSHKCLQTAGAVQVDEKKPPVLDKGTLGFFLFFRVRPFLSIWGAGPWPGYPWFLHRFMHFENPWILHGLSMDNQWIIHGLYMHYPWIIHGLSMDNPWIIHGLSMDNCAITRSIKVPYLPSDKKITRSTLNSKIDKVPWRKVASTFLGPATVNNWFLKLCISNTFQSR